MISSNFSAYKTIRTIDLRKNNITEFNHLATLPFLINLDLRFNQITSLNSLNRKPAEGEETAYWPRLQFCLLSSNKIEKITPIGCPNLIRLDISNNQISSIAEGDDGWKGHDNIQVLDISANLLTNLGPLSGLKKLKTLYAGSNRIYKFSGLEGCEELEVLNLRGNSVPNLANPDRAVRIAATAPKTPLPEPQSEQPVEVGGDREVEGVHDPGGANPLLQPVHRRLQGYLHLPDTQQVLGDQDSQQDQ